MYTTARIGDSQAGYTISIDPISRTVLVKGWGFWSVEAAAQFGPSVSEALASAPSQAVLQLDLNGLKPMRDEGQSSFGAMLTTLRKMGVASVRISVDNALTRLQILRLVSKHGAVPLVQLT
jgi:hypothetical protein